MSVSAYNLNMVKISNNMMVNLTTVMVILKFNSLCKSYYTRPANGNIYILARKCDVYCF